MSLLPTQREEIELVLLREVERTRKLYDSIDPIHRSEARQQHLRALQRFARLVEHGELPEDEAELTA